MLAPLPGGLLMISPQASNNIKQNGPSERVIHWLDHFVQKVLILLVGLMVLNVLWQIVTRFLLGNPSSFTEELARFMLIWLAMLGGVYAFRVGSNIGFDLLTEQLPKSLQNLTYRFALLVVVFFALTTMCFGGFELMRLTFELGQKSASLGIPMGFVYSIVPVSGLLIATYGLIQLITGKPQTPLDELE
jgi:TRAP-type C4-dicarboxylate transport system permease small subunit